MQGLLQAHNGACGDGLLSVLTCICTLLGLHCPVLLQHSNLATLCTCRLLSVCSAVATGALIWGKDLMPSVDDTGDDFIMLPHVDPVTGSIYQLRNNEMWRMDPVPAKPTPPPPSPSRPPSPPLPPSPPPLPPSPTRPPTPPSSPPQPDMPQQPPMYPNGNPPLVRQPTSSQDPALRPPPPSPGSAVRQGVATWLLGVALGTQLLLLILAA